MNSKENDGAATLMGILMTIFLVAFIIGFIVSIYFRLKLLLPSQSAPATDPKYTFCVAGSTIYIGGCAPDSSAITVSGNDMEATLMAVYSLIPTNQ